MSVFSMDNLYRAYDDCRRRKRNAPDALRFEAHAEDRLAQLQRELSERTYRPSTSACFVSRQPKLREIFAADFRDRILHHLVVRYFEAIWEPIFIHDSYASRRGKGIHAAVTRLRAFTRQVTHNDTYPAYYVQLDIRNFFMSVNKRILFAMLRSRCRHTEIMWLTSVLLFHDPTQDYHLQSPRALLAQVPRQKSLFGAARDTGLPIGNLTSQFWANVYLNGLDQFVKHTLRCRWYLRYVDDFVLLHPEPAQLYAWQTQIADYLMAHLELSLHPTRRKMRPISNGVDILGYIVRPAYVLCRNRVVNNLKAKLNAFADRLIQHRAGILTVWYDAAALAELDATVQSYFGHFRHADTFRLTRRLWVEYSWLHHYFRFRNGHLKRLDVPPRDFRCLRMQYAYFADRCAEGLLYFQVGCFYELYGRQALKAHRLLNLPYIRRKHGFARRCGISVRALDRYVALTLRQGVPVTVVNQTGSELGHVAERRIAVKYRPAPANASPQPSPALAGDASLYRNLPWHDRNEVL